MERKYRKQEQALATRDPTDTKTAEPRTPDTINRPLEANSISLDEAQELVHVGSWQWDVASGDIAWSDELYRIYGLQPRKQAVSYEEFMQLIYPDDREKVGGIINEAYQTKQSFEFEHRIVLPNKKIRILHGKGKVISDESGNVKRMVGTSQDITERKKSDQALHRSDERFRAVSTATSDVVYDIDLQSNTMWFNEALHTEYKYPLRKTLYTPDWRLSHVHADDRERVKVSIEALLGTQDKTWVSEYRFKKQDGAYIDVRDRAFVLRDNDKKPIRIIGSILDITQQKELERAKDKFISLVSHQLRTPLTSMRLLTEMLSSGYAEELTVSQHEYVQKIESSTVRMIQLVNEILGVSSIETGRLNIHATETDVSALIRGQIEEIAPLAEKRTKITYTPDETAQTVTVDVTLFSQIVHNLLTNAVRYTLAEGTVISVAFEKTQKEYLLTVHDHGIGIPKEAQQHIFSSFYRANNAIKARGDGTGLGLYLVHLVLDMTGGKIWFNSKEGEGSTFYVSLPLGGMANSQTNKMFIQEGHA